MKLRNKKTGEVMELLNATVCTSDGLLRNRAKNYDSLAELNEEWEDCTPAEPLIKDEKIRKAVRAWVDANDYRKEDVYQFFDYGTDWQSWSLEHKDNGDENVIHFNGGIDFGRADDGSCYTIAELCGEEGE